MFLNSNSNIDYNVDHYVGYNRSPIDNKGCGCQSNLPLDLLHHVTPYGIMNNNNQTDMMQMRSMTMKDMSPDLQKVPHHHMMVDGVQVAVIDYPANNGGSTSNPGGMMMNNPGGMMMNNPNMPCQCSDNMKTHTLNDHYMETANTKNCVLGNTPMFRKQQCHPGLMCSQKCGGSKYHKLNSAYGVSILSQ